MSDFNYTYCPQEQDEIRRIRSKYLPKEENKMERLRRLDEQVTRKSTAASLTVGILSSIVFGTGLSLCLVWELFLIGIPVGLLGMTGMIGAYPIYLHVVKKERARIAPEILKLTEELMIGS